MFFGSLTCKRIMALSLPSLCSSQDSEGYGYAALGQNINAASIRNQGWEMQGSVNTGPVTTKGTYSWTKSRTIGVTSRYRDRFPANRYPDYQPGATFQLLPEHTWALGMTYVNARTTVAFNVTGSGETRNYQDERSLRFLDSRVRLMQDVQNMRVKDTPGLYPSFSNNTPLADMTVSHRFLSGVEGVVNVKNMANQYTNDLEGRFATLGRQMKLGLRVRL
jgi:outer membrane receptor protein involved in Fe transport